MGEIRFRADLETGERTTSGFMDYTEDACMDRVVDASVETLYLAMATVIDLHDFITR